MRFLIDECLTVELAAEAHELGFEAYHVAHVGKAGWTDWNIASYGVAGGLILVTNNATDFLELYARGSTHPGLIIIVPSVSRERQRLLFRAVLTASPRLVDLRNQVVEVYFEGTEPKLRVYDFPSP